jgi:hypothetical protein
MVGTGMQTRRWTCDEYDRLIEVGLLREDDPVELVEGRLLVSEPQDDAHARAIELATDALRAGFGPSWRIRVQLPLALGSASMPEPEPVRLPRCARRARWRDAGATGRAGRPHPRRGFPALNRRAP